MKSTTLNQRVQKLAGEYLKVVWAELSTIS